MASSNRCRRRSKLSEHRGHQIPSRRQRFTFDREELSNPWHAPDINECSPYRAFRPIRNNNPKAPLSSFLILLSFYSAIIVFRISHARPSVFTSFFHRGSIKLIASPSAFTTIPNTITTTINHRNPSKLNTPTTLTAINNPQAFAIYE